MNKNWHKARDNKGLHATTMTPIAATIADRVQLRIQGNSETNSTEIVAI